jgi:hypothetical protein
MKGQIVQASIYMGKLEGKFLEAVTEWRSLSPEE